MDTREGGVKRTRERVAKALEEGRLRAVSDGSYQKQLGTAASIVTVEDMKHIIKLKCLVPGPAYYQSAHHNELAGIYMNLLTVYWIEQAQQCKGKCEIACDRLQAIKHSFSDKPLDPKQAQFALLLVIRGLLCR